jgi:phenylacetate-CoA ligase
MLRKIIFPLGDFIFGQKMIRRLEYLEKAQWWERDRINNVREKALKDLIKIAYNEVPFYQEIMNQHGIRPRDIQTPEDLNKIPIVTKDMLRSNYPQKTIRNTGQKTYEACISGSTGKNFCVREDSATAGWYRASFLLA